MRNAAVGRNADTAERSRGGTHRRGSADHLTSSAANGDYSPRLYRGAVVRVSSRAAQRVIARPEIRRTLLPAAAAALRLSC